MPYYHEIQALLNQTLEWADLRHEQGADVSPVIERLRKSIAAADASLRAVRIPAATRRRQPDALEAIRALRPDGVRRYATIPTGAKLAARMKGAWLGRAVGCTLGVPVEGWSVESMERISRLHRLDFPPTDYWPVHPWPDEPRYGADVMGDYLKGNLRYVPVDDDLTYTILGLLILEKCGPDFTTADVADAWLKHLPMACTAEHVALENLRKGIPAEKAAESDNPYVEWIGADIRSDPWAYAAPGCPEKAAEFAWRDAWLSHRGNGLYGAMYFAAAIAAAFSLDDPVEALRAGLSEIPNDCDLARDIRWSLEVAPTLKDWREARAVVDKRFAGMHPVHTNNNACLTVFGIVLGAGDFTRTIGWTVAMGLDCDCTAATAGSLLGAVIGAKGIPQYWVAPFRNKVRTYLTGHEKFTNSDIVARFVKVAREVGGAG
jgi:ADP-ribosylglycohydrolase